MDPAVMQQLMLAMQQQQALASAQLMALSSTGQLKTFDGRAESTGLAGREWLTHAEHHFAAREHAMGINAAQGDASRLHAARAALTDDALRWYSALPNADRPQTWPDFHAAFLRRFSSVPAAQAREAQLQRFVEAARRIRDKLTVDGLQRYTTMFLQRAGEIPADRMTDATKRGLYAQGLPPRYAEYVLTEDAKPQPLPLHTVAENVISKATLKTYASHGAGASAASHASQAEAMQVDAISLCAVQFGVSREEAQRYIEPQEGWAVHETGSSSASSPPATRLPEAYADAQMERLLAAIESRYGKPAAGAGAPRAQSQRRTVSDSARLDIPKELANGRKEAGLCLRCGIAKYESGNGGHNSRTCRATVDKTTSVVEGKKKAGF